MEKINIYRVVIFESNYKHERIIKKQLRNDNRISTIGFFSSLRSFKKTVELYEPDIVFVDSIMLNNESDKFLSTSVQQFKNMKIVFTYPDSVSENDVFDDYCPDYYLKKPFLLSDTVKLIDQIEGISIRDEDEIAERENSIIEKHGLINLKYGNGFLLINPSEIVYIKSVCAGCELTHKNGLKETVKHKISDLDKVLKKYNFFRLTNSVIINLELLYMIQRKEKKCILKYFDNEYVFNVSSQNVLAINKLPFINVG